MNQATLSATGFATSGPIRPITSTVPLGGTVKYDPGANGKSLTPITVTLTATPQFSWASVTVKPSSHSFSLDPSGGVAEDIPVTVQVTLTRDAPAFATNRINLQVSGTGGTCVLAPTDYTFPIEVQADFYQRYSAQFDQTAFKASQNDVVQIPLTVTNIGNGPIEIRPKIDTELTSTPIRSSITLPAKVDVNTLVTGHQRDRETVTVEVQTPYKNGYVNDRHAVWITLEGNSAERTEIALTPLSLNALIQTQGVYVPGFDTVAVLGAAALGTALLARRRL